MIRPMEPISDRPAGYERNKEIRVYKDEIARLRAALEKYTHCRHACQQCFCTEEARAALYKP